MASTPLASRTHAVEPSSTCSTGPSGVTTGTYRLPPFATSSHGTLFPSQFVRLPFITRVLLGVAAYFARIDSIDGSGGITAPVVGNFGGVCGSATSVIGWIAPR